MRIWRRRTKPAPSPTVVLPSLDRLAGLIERVVQLVDEVASTPQPTPPRVPAPTPPAPPVAPTPPPRRPEPEPDAAPPKPADETGWLAFVPSPHGYALVPRPDALPELGAVLELDGAAFRVLRYAPSPLPGDRRRCAVIAREEPPEPDRSFDA
jgi:hypothetical protein